MSEKKHLGVEFYRNFVGIEKPLRVGFVSGDGDYIADFTGLEIDGLKQLKLFLWNGGSWHCKAEQCKPYLRTIEDLSDEELLFVFGGNNVKKHFTISRTADAIYLKNGYTVVNSFCLKKLTFGFCTNKYYDRIYSIHCHPRAKEYIDNGLALRVE